MGKKQKLGKWKAEIEKAFREERKAESGIQKSAVGGQRSEAGVPVAQVGNLPCRRLAVGGLRNRRTAADCQSATWQTASLGYAGRKGRSPIRRAGNPRLVRAMM